MEFRFNGKEAVVFIGVTVMNAVIACSALHKADTAKKEADYQEFMAKAYKYDSEVNRILNKRLLEENKKLKAKLEKEEES